MVKWFKKKMIKKYVASASRKGIVAIATLMASKAPVLEDLSKVLIENSDEYSVAIASALTGFSVIWGMVEKGDDR